MRELKKTELVVGMIALIILSVTAIFLIVRKETTNRSEQAVIYEDTNETVNSQMDEKPEQVKTADDTVKQTVAIEKESVTESTASVSIGELYKPATRKEYDDKDGQLQELYNYWDQYQLDAVEDLIRLKRIMAISDQLKGTEGYYYYGALNKKNEPEGKGLAVYYHNMYYFGEWKAGQRQGNGMWIQIYPQKAATINGIKGVREHSYNGEFVNDYPNGAGQEHIEYDLEQIDSDMAFTNVIGNFSDGYYNGELYIMTIDKDGDTTDWETEAVKGTFIKDKDVSVSAMGNEAVFKKMESEGNEDTDFYWLHPTKNKNFGIYGLKK